MWSALIFIISLMTVGHGGYSGGLAHRLHPEGQPDRVHVQRPDRVPQILGQRHLVLHHTTGAIPGRHGGLRRGNSPRLS